MANLTPTKERFDAFTQRGAVRRGQPHYAPSPWLSDKTQQPCGLAGSHVKHNNHSGKRMFDVTV